MHAFVRSLAAATPVVNASVRLIARNNEVLGTAKTDSRGYARSMPASSGRGRAGAGRAGGGTPDGDYAFLDLVYRRLRPHRPRRQGPHEPGPIDAFAYTDRGVYRAGEEVYLAAIVRDKSGKAASLPVRAVVEHVDRELRCACVALKFW